MNFSWILVILDGLERLEILDMLDKQEVLGNQKFFYASRWKNKAEFLEILWEFLKNLWEFSKIKGETFCEMRRNFLGEAQKELGLEVDK